MAVRECSRTFTMLKRHILYISTILAMKVHDPKSANLPHLGSWTFMAKIVEIYRMCRFNIATVLEHLQTAINNFASVKVSLAMTFNEKWVCFSLLFFYLGGTKNLQPKKVLICGGIIFLCLTKLAWVSDTRPEQEVFLAKKIPKLIHHCSWAVYQPKGTKMCLAELRQSSNGPKMS